MKVYKRVRAASWVGITVPGVAYVKGGHSAAWVDTDVSASFSPGDIVLFGCVPSKAGGDQIGVRKNGDASTPSVGIGQNIWAWLLAQVSDAGHLDFKDDSGAAAEANTYYALGYMRHG